jgi:sugar phosphate isomerase/epimerase
VQLAFSSLACPGWTVERIADAAGRYGYDAIEWRLADGELLGPRTDDRVWERIATCGVPAVCLDTSAVFVQGDDDRRAKAIAMAKAMGEHASMIGAPTIRVFGGAIPDGTTRDAILGPTRDALAAAARAMPDGVGLLIETHDAWSSGAEIAALVDGLDTVGVLWDVAHTWRSGEDPRQTLEHIGVPGLVHVKDANGDALTHLGEGSVPLHETVKALRDAGYDGPLSLEWEKLWHPDLDDADVILPRAIDFLRAIAAAS